MKIAITAEVDADNKLVKVLSDPSVPFGEQRAKSFALASTLQSGHKVLFFDNPRIIKSSKPAAEHHEPKRKGVFAKVSVAAALFMAVSQLAATAQVVSSSPLSIGITTMPGGGTSNTTATAGIINRIRGSDVGIQLVTHTDNGTATNLIQLVWSKSVDGVYWSDDTSTWTIPSAATNQYVFTTNWTVAGLTAVKLKSLKFLAPTGTMTIDSLTYSIKRDP